MKYALEDLAILGGPPAFDRKLHVGCPHIGDRRPLIARIKEALTHKRLTDDGPFVHQLERGIEEFLGVRHCVATCNRATATQIVARALDLKGEVVLPSFTFPAPAHALRWIGLEPVFCDIDPETRNIDPERAAEAITPRTSAIVGVHLWGRGCDVRALQEIGWRHGIPVFFDASQAFGCSLEGRMIGGFGRAEILSFHASEVLNAAEGGAIVTNDDDLAKTARRMRNLGYVEDEAAGLGTNGRLDELSASLGLLSLEGMGTITGINRKRYEVYEESLEGLPGVRLLTYDASEQCHYQYVVIEVLEEEASIDRETLLEVLWAENILARRDFSPGCHRIEPYKSERNLHLPATEELSARVISLPTGTDPGVRDVRNICQIVRLAATQGKKLRGLLESLSVA